MYKKYVIVILYTAKLPLSIEFDELSKDYLEKISVRQYCIE